MHWLQRNFIPFVSSALFSARFIIVIAPWWHHIDLRVRLVVVPAWSLSRLRWTFPSRGHLFRYSRVINSLDNYLDSK